MKEIDRTDRVAELIKRELAVLIPRELADDRINRTTVTAVTVSRDLRNCTVYVSSMDAEVDSAQLEKLMNRSAGYLRRLLCRNLDLRVTPALIFRYDASVQRGEKLSRLIDRLNTGNGPRA